MTSETDRQTGDSTITVCEPATVQGGVPRKARLNASHMGRVIHVVTSRTEPPDGIALRTWLVSAAIT